MKKTEGIYKDGVQKNTELKKRTGEEMGAKTEDIRINLSKSKKAMYSNSEIYAIQVLAEPWRRGSNQKLLLGEWWRRRWFQYTNQMVLEISFSIRKGKVSLKE